VRVFRGNQPPKRHEVRIRAASGQRSFAVRYVRLSGVRVADVDADGGTVRCVPDAKVLAQIGEHAFSARVLAGADITLSAEGLPQRSRARFLRAAERAAGGGPVEVVLDGPRGRLG